MEYSPRKMMQLMETKGFDRSFLGTPSPEVMKQQLFSLVNSFKPQTMTKEEIEKWIEKLISLYEQMRNRHYDELVEDVEKILKDNIILKLNSDKNIQLAIEHFILPEEMDDCECTENKV